MRTCLRKQWKYLGKSGEETSFKRETGGERTPRGTGTQAVAIKHRGRVGLSDNHYLLPLRSLSHMLVYVYQESIFVSMFLEFRVSSTMSHGGG